jgi:hypothetical protein
LFSESLYEDENFKHRELAALVSSKVYYHLGSLDNALTYALGAGRLFDVNDKTEYVETIIGSFKSGPPINDRRCFSSLQHIASINTLNYKWRNSSRMALPKCTSINALKISSIACFNAVSMTRNTNKYDDR